MSYYRETYNIHLTTEKYNSRTTILNKFQKNIKSLDDFAYLISYNGFSLHQPFFRNDPSLKDPCKYYIYQALGVSQRYDLLKIPQFKGSIDFKIIDSKMMQKKEIMVKSGPTFIFNDEMKPLDFDNFKNYKEINDYHLGIPSLIDFDPIYFKDVFNEN